MHHRLSVAPMMDRTDRHFRYFIRLMTQHTRLYTEMVPMMALIHGNRARFLDHDPVERPLALQLGGSDPVALAEGARMAEQWGYDEVNLNVGCPSGRVTAGRFGACLMAESDLVARCVEAMVTAVAIPITVKHRIGIDDHDSYDELVQFVRTVADGGCRTFIIHARKAWLKGLSPKQNRAVPPLRHELVHAIKQTFPHLEIVTNGGIQTLAEAMFHLEHVDGVMIGRAAYDNPILLSYADNLVFGCSKDIISRDEVAAKFNQYVERQVASGIPRTRIARHAVGLYHGVPGARFWRRSLCESVESFS